jgi:hypothetical protein
MRYFYIVYSYAGGTGCKTIGLAHLWLGDFYKTIKKETGHSPIVITNWIEINEEQHLEFIKYKESL